MIRADVIGCEGVGMEPEMREYMVSENTPYAIGRRAHCPICHVPVAVIMRAGSDKFQVTTHA